MGMVVTLVALLGVLPWVDIKESNPVISKDESHFSQRFSLGKETLRIDIWRRPFQRDRHRIKLDGDQVEAVDGQIPLGRDGGPVEGLKTEIARVRVVWGGATVEVKKELFQDCFNGNLSGVTVRPSEDLRSVMIRLGGGDGAGAYDVYLIVSRDGFSTRFVAGEGGL
jgi:hypothetical protein